PGGPGDARGCSGLRRFDRSPGRRQGGRRNQDGEGRHPLPRPGQRDCGRRLAESSAFQDRCVEPGERSAHAAREANNRGLCRPRLVRAGLGRTPSMAWEYAPAPESRSIVNIRPSYGLFIDGEFRDPVDGGAMKTLNPATEEVLAEVAVGGEGDV